MSRITPIALCLVAFGCGGASSTGGAIDESLGGAEEHSAPTSGGARHFATGVTNGKSYLKGASSQALLQTEWLLRVGGTDSTCSPKSPTLCSDEARFHATRPRPDGSAIAIGSFNGAVTLGASHYQSSTAINDYPYGFPVSDVFVAGISKDGAVTWSRQFGGRDDDWLYDVVEDADGNIYVTGSFAHPLTVGATTLVTRGSVDIFVAKLDASGEPIWAVSGGSPTYDFPAGLALVGNRVVLVGTAGATAKFGGLEPAARGGTDALFATLDATTGAWTSAATMGGAGNDTARAIAKAPDGDVLIGGSVDGSADFLGTAVSAEGEADAFVVKASPEHVIAWARVVAGSGESRIDNIATSPDGSAIVVAGWAKGEATLNGATLTDLGEEDALLVSFATDGTATWARRFGGPQADRARGVVVDASGELFVSGGFTGTATFGRMSRTSSGGSDAFVASINGYGFREVLTAGGAGDDAGGQISLLGDRLWINGAVRGGMASFGGASASVAGHAEGYLWQLRRVACEDDGEVEREFVHRR